MGEDVGDMELGAELGETAGQFVGPLLRAKLVDGANDKVSIGLDDGSSVGPIEGPAVGCWCTCW